jgi:hypothetical protein
MAACGGKAPHCAKSKDGKMVACGGVNNVPAQRPAT